MKFLEAKALTKDENKMKPGTRPDQSGFIRKGQLHADNPPVPKKEVQDYANSVGVDLKDVDATGRGGEITMKDVRDHKTARDKQADQDDRDK